MLGSDDGSDEGWLEGWLDGCEEGILDGSDDTLGAVEGSLLAPSVGFIDRLGSIEG